MSVERARTDLLPTATLGELRVLRVVAALVAVVFGVLAVGGGVLALFSGASPLREESVGAFLSSWVAEWLAVLLAAVLLIVAACAGMLAARTGERIDKMRAAGRRP